MRRHALLRLLLMFASQPAGAYVAFVMWIVLPPAFKPTVAPFLGSLLTILAPWKLNPWGTRIRVAVVSAGAAVITAVQAFLFQRSPGYGIAAALVIVSVAPVVSFVFDRRRLAAAALCLVSAVTCARYVDRPAQPSPFPVLLAHVAARTPISFDAFHCYPMGPFLDAEELWRIEASPATFDTMISELQMRPATAAPARFWRMPPYYWPRGLPDGARLFASEGFKEDFRDGYFMLVDASKRRAYVWIKFHF